MLTIDQAGGLIRKYLEVKEDVVAEVEEFRGRHFGAGSVLGVHYRGTDKVVESPPVPYARVKRNIEHYLERYPETSGVFVATDDARFLEYMRGA